MARDPVVSLWLYGAIAAGAVLLLRDVVRIARGKNAGRPVRTGFEIGAHVALLLMGVVGVITYSWAIPVLGVVGFVLLVVANRFPPRRTPSDNPDDT